MRTYFIRPPRIAQLLLPPVRWQLDRGVRAVNISFDDGPHPYSTPLLLSLLDRLDMRVTFFLTGSQAHKYPDLVEEIRAAGHQIGSHGYDHLSGWSTDNQVYVDDVLRASDILCTRLYRPPYGKVTPRQIGQLERHVDIIMWSLMPGDFDTRVNNTLCADRICDSVTTQDIIVLHDHPGLLPSHQLSLSRLSDHLRAHTIATAHLPE